MDHEQAATLITDRARGQLGATLAVELDEHLRECEQCRHAWEAATAVEAQVRARGSEFLAPHPSAEEIAAYAVYPEGLAADRRTAVGSHVRACPICKAEVATARQSIRGAAWRGWRAAILGPGPRPIGALLGPVAAVLAVALLYPAYLGTFRYPAALRERDRATLAADSLREIRVPVHPRMTGSVLSPASPEVSVGSLVLAGPSRGAGAPMPVLHLRDDQRFLHVVIDHPLAAEARAAGRLVEVTIIRVGETAPAWRFESSAASLWDEGLQAAGFLVPADRLSEGAYRLEVRLGAGEPAFSAGFRVERVPPGRTAP